MAASRSAGLVLYRTEAGSGRVQVLLAHMGGPLWAGKDDGAWSIPKGQYGADEDPLAAARREFAEELGAEPPDGGTYLELGEIRQSGGKRVLAWAAPGEFDPASAVSNTFEMEWPPRSGRRARFPEVDRVAWFAPDAARRKLVSGQAALVDRLLAALDEHDHLG